MKRGLVVIICLSLILIMSLSLVSAGWFSDLWNKIIGKTTTGKTITGKVVSSEGLAAQWKFDGNAQDSSGNGNNGVIFNGVTWTAGKFGSASQFDGINDFVKINDSNSLDLGGSFTLTAWVYSKGSTKVQGIIYKINPSPTWVGYHFDLLSGTSSMKLRCMAHNTTSVSGNAISINALTKNQWHFVACVRDTASEKISLYVDGNQTATPATDNSAGKNIVNNVPLYIGSNQVGGSNFNGSIDEVKIFSRALSASEIRDLYNGGGITNQTTNQTCTDSDGGISLNTKGTVTLSNGLSYTDFCRNNSFVTEITCGVGGGWTVKDYGCPNGCSNGACIEGTTLVNGCEYLSNEVINNISRLQNTGKTVILTEGNDIHKDNYAVFPGSSNIYRDESTILKLSSVSNQTGGYGYNDRVWFTDYLSGELYTTTITQEGKGTLNLNGMSYDVTYSGNPSIADYIVKINFSQTSGSNKMSFEGCVATNTTCTDSDGGLNYYVKGYVNLTGVSYWDQCISNTFLNERYCVNSNTKGNQSYYCPNGCSNGACLSTNQTCTNGCTPSGSKRCSGNYSQTCGNYDTDSCLEWNSGTFCTYSCLNGTCF